ncbi:MAG: ABC transporter permease [Anaerolineae bacterium]
MRPRWKKVFADLWSNKTRSLLVIASITVGLFAIGMISTLRTTLGEDMRSSYLSVNAANIIVRSSGFDQDWVNYIARLPGIDRAEGAIFYSLRIEIGKNDYTSVEVHAYTSYDKMQINRVRLVEGKWPPANGEIAIEKNKLADVQAQIGDYVTIKLPNGNTHTLKLVGVVHDLTVGASSTGGGFFLAPAQGFVTQKTIEQMGLPTTYSYLYATVTDRSLDMSHIQTIMGNVLHEYDSQGKVVVNSISRRSTDHPLVIYLDAMSSVLYVLGFLVVFLSGFLVTNTLAALLSQHIEQVGVMKTIGGTRIQINGIYMVLILMYSLISLAIAIPSANLVASLENRFLADAINFVAGSRRLIPGAILLQALVAVVVPQVVGIFPVLQGTRISIQEALNGSVAKIDDQGHIYRALAHVRGLSRPLLISLRNTFRRRGRLILTLTTLILGGAIFIATFNVQGSLNRYIAQLSKYFVADVNLTFSRPYRLQEVERLAATLPQVNYVEGWAFAQAEVVRSDGLQGETIGIQAPPANSTLVTPILLQGRWVQAGDENAIVLNELFLEQYPSIHVGDTIRLEINGKKINWVVVGFFQFAGKNSGLVAYTDYDYLAQVTNTSGKSSSFRVVAADGWHSLARQRELAVMLEEKFTDAGFKVADLRSGKSIETYTSQGINVLTTFLMIMAILMALVGSIGLTGTMSLNVMDRTREIGIMRAIGISDGTLMQLVIVEGLLIGLISWLVACFAAIPISTLMFDVISTAIFGQKIQFTFVFTGVLIWLGLVTVLSVVASILPARSAARLTIREVLSYE